MRIWILIIILQKLWRFQLNKALERMILMKNYILLDEVTVQTNPDVKKIIRDYDLMTFHHGERFRVVQHCKELEDYGEVFRL